MSDQPFHVAGGFFGGNRAMFSDVASFAPDSEDAASGVARGSRRRKLWELSHKFHCPVIGVCFECGELRRLMKKVMELPKDASDFLLHTTAVSSCEKRSRLADVLHKDLEKRFQLTVRQHAGIKSVECLHVAWKSACKDGRNIPAVLWTCWTHPACSELLEQEIYGDIHMIQHQLGSHTRVDRKAMQALQAESADMLRRQEEMQGEIAVLRQEKAQLSNELERVTVAMKGDLLAREALAASANRELRLLRESLPDQETVACLKERLSVAEAEAKGVRQHAEALAREIARLRDCARHAEETIESLTREEDSVATLKGCHLSGKCVLCVGGRSGAVNSYREVVEQSGGRFLHHDGGLEESLHRIDGVVAAADVVICQAGCISHNAYWRVKEYCKRTGKPCMFVKTGGVSSFGRAVNQIIKTD